MVILQSRGNDGWQGIHQKALLPKGNQPSQIKSLSGSSPSSDLLVWLKGLALDPHVPKTSSDSFKKLWNRTLRLRKLLSLNNADCPVRKRKLQQFLSSGKLTIASRMASERFSNGKFTFSFGLDSKRFNVQNVEQLDIECAPFQNSIHTTECSNMKTITSSCNSDSVLTLEDSFQAKTLYPSHTLMATNFSSLDNTLSNHDVSPSFDTDESDNSSKSSEENMIVEDASRVDSNDLIQSLDSSSLNKKPQHVITFLKGHYRSRPVIPIGPSFQAKVPDWIGPANQRNLYGDVDLENLKWLGTRVWPLEDRSKKTANKAIGKGRPNSCPCVSQGSAECIKHHILEASLNLQFSLGPAFFNWKFDEMGEVVSKSWTLDEQRKFVALMKCSPFINEVSFLELALNYFPSKSQKNILSYYYNVFNPRRLSHLTRMSYAADSDEDQVDDNEGEDNVDDDFDDDI